MKILTSHNIKNTTKKLFIAGMLLATPIVAVSQSQKKQAEQDTFEKTTIVTPLGTNNDSILSSAPSPRTIINGKPQIAKIVVDLSKNYLYKYDKDGNAEAVYLIASGKKSTPTDTGIRVVSHIEKWPYKSAPAITKRRKNPNDYGPNAIILLKIDPQTGETSPTGEFIHGNNKPESIGKYASKGCMRMDNEVIKILSQQVKRGDIVVVGKY